jgi:Pregnancy-associated plasma protein-A/Secretion system C-terminal sorting domain
MRKHYFYLFILAVLSGYAQKTGRITQSINTITNTEFPKKCGTIAPNEVWEQAFQKQIEKYTTDLQTGKVANLARTIPVIVHVIHNGDPVGSNDNIPNNQIVSQIGILNDDFAGTGLNANSIPQAFSSAKSNTQISFCFATIDKNGAAMAEPGVDRINYSSLGISGGYPVDFTPTNMPAVKQTTIWDPSKYLNIWVVKSLKSGTTTLLGYATFPPSSGLSGINSSTVGTTLDDGLVIWRKAFGNVGILAPTSAKGRTATHEIGHYFGLRHIWGDGQCANDYCTDTPPSQQANYGCPTFPFNVNGPCTPGVNGEMFMNFMDYGDDPCIYMFSNNQNTRMQAALATSPLRSNLGLSTPTLCSFIAPPTLTNCDTTENFQRTNSNVDTLRAKLFSTNPASTWGWVSGHNSFGDIAKAEAYTYAAGTKKLVGAVMYLNHALTASGNTDLTMSYWADNSGIPASSASASANFPLAPINENALTYFAFSSPIVTSNKFYIGIDNLTYGGSQDSVSLFMAKTSAVANNTAWEKQSDNLWHAYNGTTTSDWGFKSSLCVFPVFACASAVGVEEILNPTAQTLFFPNPANDKLLISLADDNKSISAKTIIKDAYGRTIKSEGFNTEINKTINLSTADLANGIYIVELITDKQTEVKKIIVKH